MRCYELSPPVFGLSARISVRKAYYFPVVMIQEDSSLVRMSGRVVDSRVEAELRARFLRLDGKLGLIMSSWVLTYRPPVLACTLEGSTRFHGPLRLYLSRKICRHHQLHFGHHQQLFHVSN